MKHAKAKSKKRKSKTLAIIKQAKIKTPIVRNEERARMTLNGVELIPGKDYNLAPNGSFLLSDAMLEKIKEMKSYTLSSTYFKSMIE